ncbi:topoisomerase II [Methylobacterium sp. Leaf399]|uniref:DUF4864 domain-containing protein n=1 Tax=unclassified Methylobacterium TaxID=2615210 RepID=UPI0006F2ADFA|nr:MULTISPECIES: DUF4864 domain-containing protein [unclassified Methylobacterium]KQP51859.1 topoisomerase II [Methylobacterium sp. Leaf108]KQT14721.1 topoisomerase II [Methylobacterium sp. Leaf399]KQT90388.1 topoisomerase II [Methylobacterium sp. Leaf466]
MRAVTAAFVLGHSALALLTGPASSADEAARSQARATVERQIEAFRKGDASTAYAQAAPAIQTMFPSPETFLAMVRKGYAAVSRARSFSVDRIEDAGDGGMALGVKLQDEDGVDWMALYTLEKQSDGEWRINGCRLVKAPGSNA